MCALGTNAFHNIFHVFHHKALWHINHWYSIIFQAIRLPTPGTCKMHMVNMVVRFTTTHAVLLLSCTIVYDMQQRLMDDFPDLLLENCSGGGARFDPGMLYYSPQIWCSDDTDAIERLGIQEGTALVYPLSSIRNKCKGTK